MNADGLPTILIAGGGTGGHVFPGLAVARALEGLADVRVVFVGTRRGIETRVVPAEGYVLKHLEVEPMRGGGARQAVRGAWVAAHAMGSALALARSLRPVAVLSVGGYSSGPPSLACASLGVPLAILEPNNVLGLSNRLLLPLAQRVYLYWPDVGRKISERKIRYTGVPLREGFVPHPYEPQTPPRVLILGGSQGARALNESLPRALGHARTQVGPIRVVHQTGADQEARVNAQYRELGVSADTYAFLDDVATHIAQADIVVARSGPLPSPKSRPSGAPRFSCRFPGRPTTIRSTMRVP